MTAPAVPGRLLRIAVRCPRCGAIPRIKVREGEQDRYQHLAPDRELFTYECHGRRPGEPRCDERYSVPAKAFQQAS